MVLKVQPIHDIFPCPAILPAPLPTPTQETDSTRCLKNFVLALDEIDPIDEVEDGEEEELRNR